jgi:hypothetical protein
VADGAAAVVAVWSLEESVVRCSDPAQHGFGSCVSVASKRAFNCSPMDDSLPVSGSSLLRYMPCSRRPSCQQAAVALHRSTGSTSMGLSAPNKAQSHLQNANNPFSGKYQSIIMYKQNVMQTRTHRHRSGRVRLRARNHALALACPPPCARASGHSHKSPQPLHRHYTKALRRCVVRLALCWLLRAARRRAPGAAMLIHPLVHRAKQQLHIRGGWKPAFLRACRPVHGHHALWCEPELVATRKAALPDPCRRTERKAQGSRVIYL